MSTAPCATLLTLEEYMAACLDDTQRATRASLETPACPPSGQGSDRETIPAPYTPSAASVAS